MGLTWSCRTGWDGKGIVRSGLEPQDRLGKARSDEARWGKESQERRRRVRPDRDRTRQEPHRRPKKTRRTQFPGAGGWAGKGLPSSPPHAPISFDLDVTPVKGTPL